LYLHPSLLLPRLNPVLLLRCRCLRSQQLLLLLLVALLSRSAVLPAILSSVHSAPPVLLL
jgi:hypothetical protein